jgi:hypothetical protein
MKTYIFTDHTIFGEIYLHEDNTGRVRCDFSKSDARAYQITFLLCAAEGGIDNVRRSLSRHSVLTEVVSL